MSEQIHKCDSCGCDTSEQYMTGKGRSVLVCYRCLNDPRGRELNDLRKQVTELESQLSTLTQQLADSQARVTELESDIAAMADYLGTFLDLKTFVYDEGKHNKALEVARKYYKPEHKELAEK